MVEESVASLIHKFQQAYFLEKNQRVCLEDSLANYQNELREKIPLLKS